MNKTILINTRRGATGVLLRTVPRQKVLGSVEQEGFQIFFKYLMAENDSHVIQILAIFMKIQKYYKNYKL